MLGVLSRQGRPLSTPERDIFKPYFAEQVIERARIIEGHVPFWLKRSMCAVVLGHRVYLRAGAYQANTPQGVGLLGHELTHVSQFLHGMTIFSYLWSCRYGYRRSCYEIEAYARGAMIARDFQ
ncbi:MAG: DUF4157 domain-containing protein [Methylophilus sp.]|nr:DUF4157 domain-containing protein [Methylophilus sp.]MDP3608875.1 DUF4157 domain-containing protein [Methylophilus sp.]